MTDLQELSREAARRLPDGMFAYEVIDGQRTGRIWLDDSWTWLSGATAALAEIMVRVLWPAEIEIRAYDTLMAPIGRRMSAVEPVEIGSDPMQAFSTTVLRAAIAAYEAMKQLKGE